MTILGQHTVHELDDLVKALSYQIGQIVQANMSCRTWLQRDPQGYANWNAHLNQAVVDWSKAAHVAMVRIDETPKALWDTAPADAHFHACAEAFKPFEDLTRSFMQQAQCSIAFDRTPQPTAPDFDLNNYKIADKTTKWIEKEASAVASKAKSYAPVVVVGLTALAALVLALRKRLAQLN